MFGKKNLKTEEAEEAKLLSKSVYPPLAEDNQQSDLMWLGKTLGYLMECHLPGEHLVDFVIALASDGDLPKQLIGPAVDKWRQEIVRNCSLNKTRWEVPPHLAYDILTNAVHQYYEGPGEFNSTWFERVEASE